MPVVNPLVRELVFKVVYYGPGLGGKTTSLQYIHATAKPEYRGKMVSLATPVDRTLYFDFLPVRVPNVRGLQVRLQLFTVPGQVYYNATRKLVLTGSDALVFVYDSQRARMDANFESLENARENLRAHGKLLEEVPHVIQYNKRDLYDVVPIEELQQKLNPAGAPYFGSTATTGEGIYEALEAITRAVLDHFEKRVPEARLLDATKLDLPEGGMIDALRRAEDDLDGSFEPMTRPATPLPSAPISVSFAPPRFSQAPDADVGEDAARAASGESRPVSRSQSELADMEARIASAAPSSPQLSEEPPSQAFGGFGFAELWPLAEQQGVRDLERAFEAGEYTRVIDFANRLVARVLASAGALLGGGPDAPRDPATVALLIGLDGQRYLELRALVREARAGRSFQARDALRAYATAIEARRLRTHIAP